jgi:signal transduction histidine kinase
MVVTLPCYPHVRDDSSQDFAISTTNGNSLYDDRLDCAIDYPKYNPTLLSCQNSGTFVTKFSGLQIRTQLLLLALILTLPAVGIIVYSGMKERSKDYRKAVVESQSLVDGLGEKLEQLIRQSRQFGLLLTELPEVQSGNSDKVQAILTNTLKNNPHYQNILLADAGGNVWASAIPLGKGQKISVSDRAYFKKAQTTLRFATGQYAVSRSTGNPTFHVASPLVFKGKFAGAVILNINLDEMRSILGNLQLPASANYVLVDQNGIIVSRGRALGENVGKPIKSEDLKIMEAGPDRDSYEFTRKDGERRVVSYRKIRLEGEQAPYMYVRGGMSLKEAVGTANRRLLLNLLSLLPFVLFSFAIAIIIGKRSIADRVEKLREAAQSIAKGELAVRVAPCVSGGEFGELAASFDHMAEKLGENLAEIRLAQDEIKSLNADLEQKVAKRTIQLESLLKEHEAFNYTVSHDLRAPLRHISGFSAILAEELGNDAPPQCRGYLQRIRTATGRMGELIDDLLEFSRISREEMRMERVDLSRHAHEIVSMLRDTEPERTVEVIIAPDLVTNGDTTLLHIVMQNLLSNAWKYTGRTAAGRIEVGKVTVDGEDAFFIKDNGTGFDMAYKDKLFVAFQRLHGSDYEGTGIGLATVERIIMRHDGSVWAESEPGQGAVFYFRLPGASPSQTASCQH